MVTMSFDILKFANPLKAAGVPDQQAETEAEAALSGVLVNLKQLATTHDLTRETTFSGATWTICMPI